jgi:hypothetical protein
LSYLIVEGEKQRKDKSRHKVDIKKNKHKICGFMWLWIIRAKLLKNNKRITKKIKKGRNRKDIKRKT